MGHVTLDSLLVEIDAAAFRQSMFVPSIGELYDENSI